jgi:hypothetical protein
MYRGQALDFEKESQTEDEEQQSRFIWKICSSLCYDVELQQMMLSEESLSSLMQICIQCANDLKSRMGED